MDGWTDLNKVKELIKRSGIKIVTIEWLMDHFQLRRNDAKNLLNALAMFKVTNKAGEVLKVEDN